MLFTVLLFADFKPVPNKSPIVAIGKANPGTYQASPDFKMLTKIATLTGDKRAKFTGTIWVVMGRNSAIATQTLFTNGVASRNRKIAAFFSQAHLPAAKSDFPSPASTNSP